ncbi:MAG TPA: helix-turn-helix domain-containing protein [Polyangia bacterium]|nr:helix-turn-helix domain-containing protein [Polyangia bacterium]
MKRPVKRPYQSSLRAQQAEATTGAIVAAATELFSEKGYGAVSIEAIAAAAGVSRATVFTSVGGKPALLRAAFRAAFGRAAGAPHVPMPLVERPRSVEIRARPTVHGYLEGYAGLATALFNQMARVYEAIREGARSDPAVEALWVEVNAERRRGAETIVADVKARSRLRAGLDETAAADVVWVLNDPVHYDMLVRRRGWTDDQFQAWLTRALETELVGGAGGSR